MATTENLYTGNGSTVLYSFTFPYLNTTDVKVTLDGTATTAYSLANATQVQFTTAPASGVAIRIFRETASDELSASFFSGASIRANDLNNNFLQNLYVTQETEFDVNTANTTADAAKATADGAVVTANSAASDAASAVSTANTANTNATAAQTAATNAAASATAAQTSATAAQTSATAAQTSATSAQASATAAASDAASALSTANTANTNASAAVTTANTASSTASSAVTTANTANTNATAAQTAASNAATDASNAQTSASAAQTSATNAQASATAAAASAAASQNVADAFTATGTPATALSVDVPIDAANGVKLPTNSNSYDEEGAIRYNTTLDKIEIRKGSGWSTAAGGATVSSTPPSLATAGDVWYDHDNGRAYVYYNDGDSNQWVEMNPSWNGYVADNSVTSAKIVDGTIVNADVNASAAIAGTKIDPDFGSQTIETTGVFSAAGGAAATPSITFTGDLDTGIYSPGANQVGLATSGTGRLFVDASGNVGINRTPTRELTVHSPNNNNAIIQFTNDDTGSTSSDGILFGLDGNENCFLNQQEASKDIVVYTAGTGEKLRITSDGKVGVGASSPRGKLEVSDGTSNTAGEAINEAYIVGATTGSSEGILTIQSNDAMASDKGGSIAFGGRAVTSSAAGANWAFINGYKENGTTANYGGYLSFATRPNSGSISERMRIDSSGNIKLTFPDGNNGLRNKIAFTTESPYQDETAYIAANRTATSFAPTDLIFATGTTAGVSEKMRIDSSGRLLVGTSSNLGDQVLQVQGSSNDTAEVFIANSVASTGQTSTLTFAPANSIMGARIICTAEEDFSTGANRTARLSFHTRLNGSLEERMRIKNDGYIHLSNNTSDSEYFGSSANHIIHQSIDSRVALIVENSGNSTPSGILVDFSDGSPDNNSDYFMTCLDSTTTRFRIWSDGDVVNHDNSYTGISDKKLKQDIVDASSQWDDLKNLRVRKFKFISDVEAYGDNAKTLIGLVAQEVETVSPGLVKEHPDLDNENNDLGTVTKSVNYSVLYMKAVKALQEAMERIEALETQNADLAARITALETN